METTLSEGPVVLRSILDSDQEALATMANNKKVWTNLRDALPHPYTAKDAAVFIDIVKQEALLTKFAITYQGQFCGIIGLVPQQDVYWQTAEIGYWLGEPFWNKGIATVAVKLITDYGLNVLNFIRIHTGIFAYNLGSMRVLEKNGYVKEAIFKKAITKNGQVWDEHRFAISKPDL